MSAIGKKPFGQSIVGRVMLPTIPFCAPFLFTVSVHRTFHEASLFAGRSPAQSLRPNNTPGQTTPLAKRRPWPNGKLAGTTPPNPTALGIDRKRGLTLARETKNPTKINASPKG
jgi:hypothetical protein